MKEDIKERKEKGKEDRKEQKTRRNKHTNVSLYIP
jgi:hypothetical protein